METGMQNSRKKYIIVDTIIVILATVFTGVYYYYIEKGFPPYFDELANFAKYNQMIADGKLTNLNNLLWAFTSILSYAIKGYSYDAVRLNNAIMYAIEILLSLVLIILLKKEKDSIWSRWSFMPFFLYMMTLLHDGKSKYFGMSSEDFYLYPFDNHVLAIIFSLLVFIFIELEKRSTGRKKKVLALFTVLFLGYGLISTDSIFVIICVLPLILVYMRKVICKKSVKKHMLPLIAAFLAMVFFLRILSYNVTGLSFLNAESMSQYGGVVYGISNFGGIYTLLNRVYIFICGILGIYNCLFFDKAILNLNTFSYVVRMGIILVFLVYSIKCIKCWIKGKEDETVKIALILGSYILCAAFLLADFGEMMINIRYLPAVLTFSTIVLSLLEEKISLKLMQKGICNAYKIQIVAFALLIAIYIQPVYSNTVENVYDSELDEIAETIKSEKLGDGIAPWRVAYNISAKLDCEYYVDPVDYNGLFLESIKNTVERQSDYYNYILIPSTVEGYLYSNGFDKDELVEQYGRWDKQYEFDEFTLYYYKDGINDWNHCIMDYQSTQICRNENVHAKNKQLQINEDGVIYGPYANLERGNYRVTILGENLLAAEYRATVQAGKKELNIEKVCQRDDKIEYVISLENEEDDVEFIIDNVSSQKVFVDTISIKKEAYSLNFNFDNENICYTEGVVLSDSGAVINEGITQFGPYIALKAGKYKVDIYGKKLNDVAYKAKADFGETELPMQLVTQNDKKIEYILNLEKDTENVEITFTDSVGHQVIFERMNIEEIQE